MKTSLPALALALLWAAPLPAQPPPDDPERAAYIRAHYSKFEYRIPMRDGAKLFASVYVPNQLGAETWPILLVRTPYDVGPYGLDRYKDKLGPSAEFEKEQFIFAFEDVRGRYMSEGDFVNMRPHLPGNGAGDVDESTDTYDTIDWLVKNVPRNNGKVGTWGISYPGFYAAMSAIDSHPALKAVSPQAPIADWFWDDMHRHGAFNLNLAFGFFSTFGKKREAPTSENEKPFEWKGADGYQFFLDLGSLANVQETYFHHEIGFWNDIAAHPNYDAFWQSRNILPHLKKVKPATMIVGGLFDMEDLYGPMKIYREIEKNNPGNYNILVFGPWRHGGWVRTEGDKLGHAEFGFKTSEFYRKEVDLEFFKHFLKGGPKPDLPEALVFETGANRWRSFDAWPPRELKAKKLFFQDGGRLSFDAPKAAGEDSYPSDPAKPVPYTMTVGTRWNPEYMTEDQRFAAWRPDVLVYKTDVLDSDVTLAGPLEADLWVKTTAEDADFVVKLIDVYPAEAPDAEKDPEKARLGGQQMLVRGEILRGRFRDSYENPKPFTPNEATHVAFELQDVMHTFQRGHRILIQVQSSWFPLIDRNPQKWVPNIFEAKAEDFVKATHTVIHSPEKPSGVEVGVLP